MSKKTAQCPLFVNRTGNETVCSATGARPTGRRRCGAEVKAAVLFAAELLRRNKFMMLGTACAKAGIDPSQFYLYFRGLSHARNTAKGYIPKRRIGTDPGTVVSKAIVDSVDTVVAVDTSANLKGTEKKIAELEYAIGRLKMLSELQKEVERLGYTTN